MGNEIRILFIIYRFNFSSCLDTCTRWLKFRTWKSIRLCRIKEREKERDWKRFKSILRRVRKGQVDLQQNYPASIENTSTPYYISLPSQFPFAFSFSSSKPLVLWLSMRWRESLKKFPIILAMMMMMTVVACLFEFA